MKSKTLALALILAWAVPAAAQRATHQSFTFLDNDVTIEVLSDLPGTLQVVRGEPGRIDVTGRVPGGLSSAALGGTAGDHLRLSAVGGSRAAFIVVVPENVYLRVRLPNRKVGELGSNRPGGTFSWGGDGNASAESPAEMPAAAPAPSGPVVAHTAPQAPRQLSIPRLTTVKTISVRLGASSFDVAGNHYMSVRGANDDKVEIRTGNEPEELVIDVPAGTRDFTLKLAGHTALVIRGAEVTSYCDPVTEQVVEGGAHWFTFAPEAGRLTCH